MPIFEVVLTFQHTKRSRAEILEDIKLTHEHYYRAGNNNVLLEETKWRSRPLKSVLEVETSQLKGSDVRFYNICVLPPRFLQKVSR